MESQCIEFQTTIQKFIEEAIAQLSNVSTPWISLYIHISNCDKKDFPKIIAGVYTQLESYETFIIERDPKLIADVAAILFVIDENLYQLPLGEFWDDVKKDQYNTKMFWKWIKKIFDIASNFYLEWNTGNLE
tara:strand:- start:3173 stop:3568 length:396 start_codon:yes stop_codon:yes gene_type:complete